MHVRAWPFVGHAAPTGDLRIDDRPSGRELTEPPGIDGITRTGSSRIERAVLAREKRALHVRAMQRRKRRIVGDVDSPVALERDDSFCVP